jgi:hypothetical protein
MPRPNRIERESRTIATMIDLYCKGNHFSSDELCSGCQELKEYAMLRLSRCPYQNQKPTCGQCPIHCYKPEYRQQIRQVMRFTGPRMIWKHPLVTMQHLLDQVFWSKSLPDKTKFK